MKCRTLSAATGMLVMTAVAAPTAQSVENEPGRIVGGTVSTSSPAAAAMYRWDSAESRMKFACTSTMLSETKVLTARHCVDGVDERFVRVGSLKHASGGTTHDIKSAVMHPSADLAVLTLATAATDAKTTKLASTNPTKGDTTTLYGWGRTSYSSGPSPDLKQTNVPVLSTTSSDNYGGSGIQSGVGDGHAWRGDSGGPQLNAAGEQVGVCSIGSFGNWQVYTSVAKYLPWIKEQGGLS